MGNLKTLLKHIISKHFETYEEFWQHFETHNLKTIETYGDFLKTL